VREIDAEDGQQRREPPQNAGRCEPAEPKPQGDQDESQANVEIEKAFEEENVPSDQERPARGPILAGVRLTQKKTMRWREQERAEAQENAARSLDRENAAEHGEARVHAEIRVKTPISAIPLREGVVDVVQVQ